MKKVFAVFSAVILMPAYSSFAWIGGPFSQNSYFENGDDGVYEAIAATSNGVGLYRFAVRNNGVSGESAAGVVNGLHDSNVFFNGGLIQATSSNVWYYKGITYLGPCFGTASIELGIVTAIGNASSTFGGGAGQGGINPGGVTQGVNNITIANPTAARNIAFANSNWTATITQEFPLVRFRGHGTVSFVGATVDTTVRTVTFNHPVQNLPDGTTVTRTTVFTDSEGDDEDFSQVGHRRRILVYGTKVSHRVFPGG